MNGVARLTLPGGAFEISELASLGRPTLIAGAGAGNTTLRGGCGAGGIAAAAGARVMLANMSLVGVSLAASGAGAALELFGVVMSWAGCGCKGAAVATVGSGAELRTVDTVCTPADECTSSCNVELLDGGIYDAEARARARARV